MAQEQIPDPAITSLLSDFNTKLRDMEEKQRLIKDRLLLIGKNIVSERSENLQEISLIKVNVDNLSKEVERIKDTLSSLIEEIQKLARKSELEILQRQFKMFEPLKEKRS